MWPARVENDNRPIPPVKADDIDSVERRSELCCSVFLFYAVAFGAVLVPLKTCTIIFLRKPRWKLPQSKDIRKRVGGFNFVPRAVGCLRFAAACRAYGVRLVSPLTLRKETMRTVSTLRWKSTLIIMSCGSGSRINKAYSDSPVLSSLSPPLSQPTR